MGDRDERMTCAICDDVFRRLATHVRVKHNMSYRDYVIRYEYDGVVPTCECGCGEPVTFHKGSFRRFVRGHAVRDDVIRSAMIEGGRSAARDRDKRMKNSIAIKRLWTTESYRNKQLKTRNDPTSTYCTVRAERLKKIQKTQRYRDRLREAHLKLWSDPTWSRRQRKLLRSRSFRDKVATATKRALADPTVRTRLSNSIRAAYARGDITPMSRYRNIERGWMINPTTSRRVWYDSGWERDFMLVCHDLNVVVIREHGIRIRYEDSSGITRTYFPDFFVPAYNLVVEVKGRVTSRDELKHTAADSWCTEHGMSFSVLNARPTIDNVRDMFISCTHDRS